MYNLTGQLPDSVKVGAYRFQIYVATPLRSQSDRAWGICDLVQHTITYQEDWPCIGKALDTVIHEILHALYYVWDVPDEADEEAIVSRIGTGFATFLIDNPAMADWINRAAATAREE